MSRLVLSVLTFMHLLFCGRSDLPNDCRALKARLLYVRAYYSDRPERGRAFQLQVGCSDLSLRKALNHWRELAIREIDQDDFATVQPVDDAYRSMVHELNHRIIANIPDRERFPDSVPRAWRAYETANC